ncbi:uncharacterized protein K02A2.6-like [Plodia interpunctella]|uniref:uncharacterized protein K02A2.6-like n=1 Tax=Plodia interpunctella TaxID=58824 RepID=UPI002368C384|nr:uncharacterized protein K02A2.6-like [Plodia interpunctella]
MENTKAIKFEEFNPQVDNWDVYINRLKFCFEANGVILDSVKRANFFTVCGARVFETLLALITPRTANNVTFNEVETILTRHYSPKPNEISMSYQFYKRDQKRGEKVADYVAELRKISAYCNFSDLERTLRDRLVCGMCDQKLQYDLLKRDNLRYHDVVDAMFAAESAGRDVRMIQTASMTELGAPSSSATSSVVEPMDINVVNSKLNTRFCYRCGDKHPGECRFLNAVCHFCKKKGHIEKICISKKKNAPKQVNFTSEGFADNLNGIYCIQGLKRVPPYEITVLIGNTSVRMQVDTGASFSILNEKSWSTICKSLPHTILRPVSLSLHTWTETPVKIVGQATLPVTYKEHKQDLSVVIAKGCGPNLLGRNWFEPLNITMNVNFVSHEDDTIENLFDKYKAVFKEGLGTYRGHPVTIHLKPGATPKFLKARPVPFAIKERVEKEIDRLENEGVLRPTSFANWATPVVPIIKKSGEIRLCGDYRSTVNEATESDTYPMPTANEVFATIAGGKIFTTLDLDKAYTQVTVDESTAKLLTLNTCKGLYTVHRLVFGVKACPGIFQRLMTSLLAGIPGVAILIDDIIICGCTVLEMLNRLDIVLDRIEKAGLRLYKNKCKFAKEKVEFLGFVIDAEGIHPAKSKVESIVNTPAPKNKQELQAFLGLYNFYERFIRNKATLLEPLHRLLDSNNPWKWTTEQQSAFDTAKNQITFDLTLVHYDLNKPLILTCDSSEYGVGAVLSHKFEDDQERPIAMASRTLHVHERRYSQLDKEATSIMFGITKFHNYLVGRNFCIITDHKPLLGIFDPKKPMSNMISPRLTRIAIALSMHDYDITYKPGPQIGNADSLSRWPRPVPEEPETQLCDVLLMAETPKDFPFQPEDIAKATKLDATLLQVIYYIQRGWPAKEGRSDLHPYWLKRAELSVQEDCILLGCRVVIPESLRQTTLQILHKTHSGIVQTKSLARSYVWWPRLNDDIESLVSGCKTCLEHRHMPPKSTHEWITPVRPWSRVHIDFAGPFQNKYFLILVDAYSRWPEIFMVNNTTSATVIRHLRLTFATHGLCEVLVSDNGTSFVSAEMEDFLRANNIRHITTAPYHPATNGLAERMVQTVKDKLKKLEPTTWDIKIPNLLLGLRVTPCTSTNRTPAELLMRRRLRTILDTIHPENIIAKKRDYQIENNSKQKHRETNVGRKIMYRNYRNEGPRWSPGVVIGKSGPSSYQIRRDSDGGVIDRHMDQVISLRKPEDNNESNMESTETTYGETEAMDVETESIIEIPDADQWAEMLGIPFTAQPFAAEPSSNAGKIRNKLSTQPKIPYQRPSTSSSVDYIL